MSLIGGGVFALKSQNAGDTLHPYNTFWTNNTDFYTNNASAYQFSLLRFVASNGVYGINRFNNNVYVAETGGNTFQVTLAPGTYTAADLAGDLAAGLNGVGSAFPGQYTVTDDPLTSKFTITIGGGNSFVFTVGAYHMYDVLGFYPSNFAVSSIHVADAHYNLNGTQYIEVRMNIANRMNFFGDGLSSVMDMIPVSVGFGETIMWEPTPGVYPSWVVSADQLSNIQVQLRDDHQNYWELPATDHYEILFTVVPLNASQQ